MWHSSWSRMRGTNGRRRWLRWSEFDGLLRIWGCALSPYLVCRALAHDPPAKVRGSKRYTMTHAKAARRYWAARTKGISHGL